MWCTLSQGPEQRERLKPTSGRSRGGVRQLLPEQKPSELPHAGTPCPRAEHWKAEQRRAVRNRRGHLRGRKPAVLFPIFCCVPGSWELTAFAGSPAAEHVHDAPHAAPGAAPCSASGHTHLGDAELHASGQMSSLLVQFQTKLGGFFLTLLSISGEKLFCV